VRFVRDKGLTDKSVVRVETVNNLLELRWQGDGRVTVDMNAPVFDLERVPFDAEGLVPQRERGFELWPISLEGRDAGRQVAVAVLSMGNPHAVLRVDDVENTAVATLGPTIEGHARFPHRVNAGFMQVVSRHEVALRVYERGAGETLACGTGACAAVVAGIRLGWLDERVEVHTRGGRLSIEWPGRADDGWAAHVLMTGPAETVYEGEIDL
jgi:diaminopimelate epimerase